MDVRRVSPKMSIEDHARREDNDNSQFGASIAQVAAATRGGLSLTYAQPVVILRRANKNTPKRLKSRDSAQYRFSNFPNAFVRSTGGQRGREMAISKNSMNFNEGTFIR